MLERCCNTKTVPIWWDFKPYTTSTRARCYWWVPVCPDMSWELCHTPPLWYWLNHWIALLQCSPNTIACGKGLYCWH